MKKNNLIKMILLLYCVIATTGCSSDDPKTARPIAFAIAPETLQFNAAGGNSILNISIDPKRTWTIANDAAWVTIEAASGTGMAHLAMVIAANDGTDTRSTTVTVTSNSETKQLVINQAGGIPAGGVTYAVPPDPTNMGTMTSVELTAQMGTGWNLGNTLEATGGETAWGNPMVTHQFIDAVKAAGFNTIRIPVSWSNFTDAATFTINPAWLARVEEVVNYARDNDMYVIMNEHWDGGWMQPTNAQKDYVNNRLGIMWTQIATHFRDYDYHLIFAGSNEVMVTGDYGTPTAEYYMAQNSFNQTFVTAVRATGGRNAYRYLTVQGFNTNIDHTYNFAQIPNDVDIATHRLLMEVHFYDPYDFTLNETSTITQWGSIATDVTLTEDWANEAYVDTEFQKMKTKFIDQGVGVILGEFGAIVRTDVAGSETYRNYYLHYVSNSARTHGLVPVYWDNGAIGNHTMALFNRTTGELVYPDIAASILH